MARARVVIGANFGDEGKGLVTDWLCAQGSGMVVRFNGGSQAGHTVVAPDGKSHVFSHFGSGTFLGVPTFLSQYFVCNPIIFLREMMTLRSLLGKLPHVYAHPQCLVTTFADMIINQWKEENRGTKRHGSCGLGVNETTERSQVDRLKITMADLWNGQGLEEKLHEICGKWATFRTGSQIEHPAMMMQEFIRECKAMAEVVHPLGIAQCRGLEPVFEGAQGLLLDQGNKEFFPHVTRSNTGMKNVRALCAQAGLTEAEIFYVSRTYLTRHGAGPLPGEDPGMKYEDLTNLDHPWQGKLRFGRLDSNKLIARCNLDAQGGKWKLVMTHCDQLPGEVADVVAFGPSRETIEYKRLRVHATSGSDR